MMRLSNAPGTICLPSAAARVSIDVFAARSAAFPRAGMATRGDRSLAAKALPGRSDDALRQAALQMMCHLPTSLMSVDAFASMPAFSFPKVREKKPALESTFLRTLSL